MVKIVAQTTEPEASVEFDYEIPENLADLVTRFGEQVVFSHVKRSIIIAAQGTARGLMKGGKNAEAIQQSMDTWKPGEPRAVKSAADKISTLVDKLTPEEREALVAELRGSTEPTGKKGKKAE
jgi:hypothetical protein